MASIPPQFTVNNPEAGHYRDSIFNPAVGEPLQLSAVLGPASAAGSLSIDNGLGRDNTLSNEM